MANNRREKAVLGAYAGPGDGERIWMSPRINPKGQEGPPGLHAKVPGQIAKMDTKDLVRKMEKKEAELKDRLESARKAQQLADIELASGFKSFSDMQVSARRAIREGTY